MTEMTLTVTPSLTCTPCADAIEFYKRAFGAVESTERMTAENGLVAHAEIRIGDSSVMLGDEWPGSPVRSPASLGASTAAMFIYTSNVEALWEQAINAGATEVYPLELQFYGDKAGRVMDPFGHTWGLGQHIEDVSSDEMERRVAAFWEENPSD